eukprot:4650336-Pyramimonas_sp.AAC.1
MKGVCGGGKEGAAWARNVSQTEPASRWHRVRYMQRARSNLPAAVSDNCRLSVYPRKRPYPTNQVGIDSVAGTTR